VDGADVLDAAAFQAREGGVADAGTGGESPEGEAGFLAEFFDVVT